jgi:hypothetical protein
MPFVRRAGFDHKPNSTAASRNAGIADAQRWPGCYYMLAMIFRSARHTAVCASLGVLAVTVTAPAAAKNADQIRRSLIGAHLTPRPLYPSILPAPLQNESEAQLVRPRSSRHMFTASFLCRCDPSDGSYYSVILTFARGPVSDIAKEIAFSEHVQRHRVRRERIGGRRMYRFQTDTWFGYMWRDQQYAYEISEHYSDQVGWRFIRQFVKSLVPLGDEWVGRTSQGRPITLYRSRAGLDYDIHWLERCTVAGATIRYTEASPLLRVTGGAFSESGAYKDDDGRTVDISLTGTLRGNLASGDFSATVDGFCDVGPVTWTAARLR